MDEVERVMESLIKVEEEVKSEPKTPILECEENLNYSEEIKAPVAIFLDCYEYIDDDEGDDDQIADNWYERKREGNSYYENNTTDAASKKDLFVIKEHLDQGVRANSSGAPLRRGQKMKTNDHLKSTPVPAREQMDKSADTHKASFYRFYRKSLLKPQHPNTVKKLYQCHMCNYLFLCRELLSEHMLNHKEVKPFQCYICKRTFSQKVNLATHIRIHANVKPYECAMCQKKFTQKGNLARHIRVHGKPFRCGICKRMFARREDRTRHCCALFVQELAKPQNASGEDFSARIQAPTEGKRLECVICSSIFHDEGQFAAHIHAHATKYTCHICKKSFTYKPALVSHLRSHSHTRSTGIDFVGVDVIVDT